MTLGSRPLASSLLGSWSGNAVLETGVRIEIGGSRVNYLREQTTIDLSLEGRASATVKWIDESPFAWASLEVGAIVTIWRPETGSVIFAGTIDKLDKIAVKNWDSSDRVRYTVKAVDFSQIADRFQVNDVLDEGLTLNAAILKIVNESTKMHLEGVTTAGVIDDDLLTIPRTSFDRKTATKALNTFAEMFDLVWWINHKKVLCVCRLGAQLAPAGFGTGLSQYYARMRISQSRRDYRNVQYLRAGNARTKQRVDEFEGTGEDTTFSTRYKLAETHDLDNDGVDESKKPKLEIDTGSGFVDVSNLLGVKDKDDEDLDDADGNPLYEWFWEPESNDITQSSRVSALGATDTGRITYTGLFPIYTRADDPDEQAARVAVEGGTGIYEATEEREEIDTLYFAEQYAFGRLRRFGRLPKVVSLTIPPNPSAPIGFRPGQQIQLEFSDLGVTGSDWLITNVTMNDLGVGQFQTILRIESGLARHRSDFQFWREAFEAGAYRHENSDKVKAHLIRHVVELTGVGETTTKDESDTLDSHTLDDISTARMGSARMGFCRMGMPTELP